MPVTKKTFDLVEPIFYDLANEDNTLIYNEFNTAQGMDLVSYEIFKDLQINSNADVPLLHETAYLVPIYLANFSSNSLP